MSLHTIQILIAGVLFVHGVGHTLGYWKPPSPSPKQKLSASALIWASRVVWTLVALGFIISAMSFYGWLFPAEWWRPLAVGSAVLSLIGLMLFGKNWPVFNYYSAAAVNLIILAELLYFHLPPYEMFNR